MTTILLLDDDRDLRALLRPPLVARGFEVLEAGLASEAAQLLAERAVDLIVVDGHLPDGSGVELIARVRAGDRSVRLVFLSAFFRDLETFRYLTDELDVSLVVYKPIEPDRFAADLAGLLAPVEPAAAMATAPPANEADALAIELAALRQAYADNLPERLAELEAAVAEARTVPEAVAHARTLAHRLRGSAGSYGFAALGEAVGLAEDLLIEAARDPHRHFLWKQLDDAVHDARLAARPVAEPARHDLTAPMAVTRALLVVDDDPDFLHLVKGQARRLLVDVIAASTVDEALECARDHDLIGAMLDVHLDHGLSFRLAHQLRTTPGHDELPIAFASVDGRMETRVAAIEAGASRFFDKPLSEQALGELVHQLVRQAIARKQRVLIVDDDVDVAAQYAHHLKLAGYAVDHLGSADALIERLEDTRPDLLLLDVELPRISGIDVCRALRISERWALLPILIVTAYMDAATRTRAFRAGASDVIGKPVLADELLARVNVQAERARLIRDRADKDALSGLLLRRAFAEAFHRALAGCSREGKSLSLVLIDIDHFKAVNDTYGHLAGDMVIARIGELLRRRFRIEDLRARWGGEEFVLVFPGQGIEFAIHSAQRLLAEFSALSFVADDGRTFSATFTAGVAAFPQDGSTMAALVRCADELLLAGKRAGRRVVQRTRPPTASDDREESR